MTEYESDAMKTSNAGTKAIAAFSNLQEF